MEQQIEQEESLINFSELWIVFRQKWYWVLISLTITISLAVIYILTTSPVYTRKASVLIKEEGKAKGLTSDVTSAFADMGLVAGNVNVNNELITMQSPMLMSEVVKRLDLQNTYSVISSFHRKPLYGSELPMRLVFHDLSENATARLEMTINADGTAELDKFVRNGEELASTSLRLRAGETKISPLGKITLERDERIALTNIPDIRLEHSDLFSAIEKYSKEVKVSMTDEKSSVLELSIDDQSIERADNILNTLIGVYNESYLRDKNIASQNASKFIDDRLQVIVQDLGSVDKTITAYKSKNLLPDVEEASKLYMSQMTDVAAQITALKSQEYMAKHVRNMLRSLDKSKLLPVNGNIQNPALETQIKEFNELLLKRNNYVLNSGEHSPLVRDLDESMEHLKPAILASLDNQLLAVQTQIKVLEGSKQQTTNLVAASPEQANFLLSEGRQQKVKEALYLYLLQKREENELTQAFTANNTRVISIPNGSPKATFPKKANILAIAFILGLAFPLAAMYLKVLFDNKVRSRKDFEHSDIPFVGELPEAMGEKNRLRRRKSVSDIEENPIVVVENGRDIINEAFRSVRTNLEFMLGRTGECRVVMGTSLVPSSGKTFVALNLAKSFALKGKRVLLIDMDIRRARTSKKINSPHIGIANYLSEQVDRLTDILYRNVFDGVVDVIPVGTIPPNPTELLESPRLEELLVHLKEEYDVIFLDCPPVEIVADVDIIKNLADHTLFVVRAETIDKTALPHIEAFYKEKRFNGMMLLLNGTSDYHRRYGYGNYSYNYNHE